MTHACAIPHGQFSWESIATQIRKSIVAALHPRLVFAYRISHLARIRQIGNIDFHFVLSGTGNRDPADAQNAGQQGLLDLDVANVIVLDFGGRAIKDSA